MFWLIAVEVGHISQWQVKVELKAKVANFEAEVVLKNFRVWQVKKAYYSICWWNQVAQSVILQHWEWFSLDELIWYRITVSTAENCNKTKWSAKTINVMFRKEEICAQKNWITVSNTNHKLEK